MQKVLVANRGEIAVRIIRTCREMGIESVAIYSEADANALHIVLANFAEELPGSSPADTYLNIPLILEMGGEAYAGIGTDGSTGPRLFCLSGHVARPGVYEVEFDLTNGNVLGFARDRSIAVSPLSPMPHKTRFHEIAHVLLGHTAEGVHADSELTPRTLRECEAEAVALICCAALELPGVEHARGYIQSWWGTGNEIPERSAQRILKTADQILKAGTPNADGETAL